MTRLALAALAAALASVACSTDTTSPRTRLTVDRVVLVSVDGLRGDALAAMPTLSALRARAVWTDSMLTVAPALTLPGHLSMFTGRDVTTLGVTDNDLDAQAAMSLTLNGATSVFQWVRDHGGRSAALVAGSLIPAEQLEQARAFLGIDTLVAAQGGASEIADVAIQMATAASRPELLFVHIPDADVAGHSAGWITDAHSVTATLTPEYAGAAARVDSALARIWTALQPAVDGGTVALIVTSDHGGGHGTECVQGTPATHEHCMPHAGDRTIPFVLVARGAAAGRLSSGTVMQVATTVGTLLGAEVPAAAARAVAY